MKNEAQFSKCMSDWQLLFIIVIFPPSAEPLEALSLQKVIYRSETESKGFTLIRLLR